jgi:branched-chain amino acid transport system substrate-binding protein
MEYVKHRIMHLTRRHFLQTALAVAGGIAGMAAASSRGEAMALPPANPAARVGLLLPQSSLYPHLGESFLDGMRTGLWQAGATRVLLVAAEVGIGVSAAVARCQQLIADEGVDLVVSAANANVAAAVGPMLDRSGRLFIGADGGANLARPDEQGSRVFWNSLGYWRANWAMGAWAARQMGRKAFVAASFYESGYDSINAFRLGFESAGGQVVQTSITHVPPEATDWQALSTAIRQAKPDFVYGLYAGQPAVDFVQAYAAAGLAGRIPLAAAPFTVDETLLPELGDAALGIRSCLPWSAALDTAENQAFAAALQAETGRAPNAFALLGYDTALMVAGALRAAGSAGDLRLALERVSWASPRGRLKMNAATHSTVSPLYVREVKRSADRLQNVVIATLPEIGEQDERLEPLRTGVKTGWLNTYLGV